MKLASTRYNKETNKRELHYHIILYLMSGFAFTKLVEHLTSKGMAGYFKFGHSGWPAYLSYLFRESPKKLLADIDHEPLSYPPGLTWEMIQRDIDNMPKDQKRKNGLPVGTVAAAPPKKRKMMTFSELTHVVVENKATHLANRLALRCAITHCP